MAPYDLLIRNTSQAVTCAGDAQGSPDVALAAIPRAAIGVANGRIAYLGPESNLGKDAVGPATEVLDAGGGFVGPGFVDAHTHAVFAGERSEEFERRCAGATYAEIAAAGGGIVSTVAATRAASEEGLVELALPRLKRLLSYGVTTAEVKSGYGLTLEAELRILRAVRALSTRQPISLVPTLLCAHALPPEHRADRARYVSICVEEILPAVAEQGLARFCDAFVEQGAFTVDEARRLLTAARGLGLRPRVHAEQLSASGGAALAAELGAASADHLEHVTPETARALAQAGVVATLVPTSTLLLGLPRYAPGRVLREAGVTVALGTNLNPGSAMSENHALTLGLACLGNGLTPAEAYWSATRGSALSLGLPEAGQLVAGGPADLVVFSCEGPRHLPYRLAVPQISWVVLAGRRVVGPNP